MTFTIPEQTNVARQSEEATGDMDSQPQEVDPSYYECEEPLQESLRG